MSYTIKDIASRAGVSKSTVSRIIAGNGYASKDARKKVLDAIQELKYKPNAVARAMVSQRTKNIGVIIYREQQPIASHPFFGKILDGIIVKAESLGYSVFVTTDKEMSLKSADFMLEKRVDGLILISRLNQEVIGYIDNFDVPYLMVNGTTEKEGIIQIVNDDEKGGEMVANHLFHLGHRRFFVVAGPQEHRSHHLRLKGFRDRVIELGGHLHHEKDILYTQTSNFEDSYKVLTKKWKQFADQRPTALFATNDMLALGAIRALMKNGVHVPEDLAVVGFDNIDYAQYAYPPLTTVHVDKMRMGEDAVVFLDDLIQKKQVDPIRINYQPRIIIRESSNGGLL